MSINIPDSLPKLLILLGIICFGFGFYTYKEYDEEYSNRFDRFDKIQDSVDLKSFIAELEKEKLLERSKNLSEIYQVENPIFDTGTSLMFNRTFSGNKNKILVTDSLDIYWEDYSKKWSELKVLIKREEIELKNLNEKESVLNSKKKFYLVFSMVGVVFFTIGLMCWILDVLTPVKEKIKQQERIYRYCQSCGHNFTSMRFYGTKKDKSINYAFCIKCYKKGKFTQSKLTKEEFIKQKKEEIKDQSWLTRKTLMNRFENLERWNRNKYL